MLPRRQVEDASIRAVQADEHGLPGHTVYGDEVHADLGVDAHPQRGALDQAGVRALHHSSELHEAPQQGVESEEAGGGACTAVADHDPRAQNTDPHAGLGEDQAFRVELGAFVEIVALDLGEGLLVDGPGAFARDVGGAHVVECFGAEPSGERQGVTGPLHIGPPNLSLVTVLVTQRSGAVPKVRDASFHSLLDPAAWLGNVPRNDPAA